jgi:hypothetical protein
MRCGLVLAVAAAVCGAPQKSAAYTYWGHHEAIVTIDDVNYTLPNDWNTALRPRDPFCRRYEGFDMVISGRALFINGALAYQAKRFDRVYVDYPFGVIVNGRVARPRTYKALDTAVSAQCGYWD